MATEQLFISVVIILVAARLLGEFFQRLKMPPLVGELAAGIIIGPYILKLIAPNESLGVLSDLAVFFLMLLAGLQMDPREIRKAGLHVSLLPQKLACFVALAPPSLQDASTQLQPVPLYS